MMRGKGVHIAGKLSYRAEVLAIWRANPKATREQVRQSTGAPQAVITKLRRELVSEGVLRSGGERW